MRRSRAALIAVSLVAALLFAPAVGAEEPIQPGASITTGEGFCTLSWIFDGTGALSGNVYASTAAHCVGGVGDQVDLASTSLGTSLGRIGEVAFVGDPEERARDYAFIALDDGVLHRVDPALKGHPQIPTGVSTDYAPGDLIQFSGHGVGFHLTDLTREQRIGILNHTDGQEHEVVGPVSPGDSGGPVGNITDGNTAFGIVSTLGVGVNTGALLVVVAGEGGPNLDFVLDDAAANGFTVSLRTV